MQVTPFKYVIDAHVFAVKNFENIVRLCLLAGVIGTVSTVLDFGTPPLLDAQGNFTAVLTWDLAVTVVVNFILSVMFTVPYIQYAHTKSQRPTAHIRPHIQMSLGWNKYKTAYLIASLKVFAMWFALIVLVIVADAVLSVPPLVSITVFLIAIAFILRLYVITTAAALGDSSDIKAIWHITQTHTGKFMILIVCNVFFMITWGVVISILSTPFLTVDTWWAEVVGTFIQIMLTYAMTLAIAHSFLLLYTAIKPSKHTNTTYDI